MFMVYMFTLITGVPGAGKTFFALVNYIIPEFIKRTDRQIITNIPLNMNAIEKVFGQQASESITIFDGSYSEMMPYQNAPGDEKVGALFVIDECQEHFTKDQIDGTDVFAHFTRHRKYGQDFVLLTQNPGLISRKVRALVEYAHYLSKTRSLGGGGYIVKTYAGQSSRAKPISQQEHEYKPEYYGFYHSYSKDGVKEISDIKAKLVTKVFVFLHKHYLLIAILLLLMSAYTIFGSAGKHKKSVVKEAEAATVAESRKDAPKEDRGKGKDRGRDKPAQPERPYIEGVTGYRFEKNIFLAVDDRVVSCSLRRYELGAPSASGSEGPGLVDYVPHPELRTQPGVQAYRVVPCHIAGSQVEVKAGSDYRVRLADGRVVD